MKNEELRIEDACLPQAGRIAKDEKQKAKSKK